MKQSTFQRFTLVSGLALILILGGCAKKTAPPPTPPTPPPPAPTASLTANPDNIQQGQTTNLTWRTENATDVSITGLGKVDPNGSQSVSPGDSTTYTLTATGPGGTQQATARVTVTVPPPQPQPSATDEQLFNQNVRDAFFDYDKFNIRDDARAALQADVQFLQQHPNITFTIEGHCDERGSIEYNQALGDNRARSALDFLVQAGINPSRMRTVSYGKEKPFCNEHNEECWQQNRRAHFVYGK
ncbi:MAG TPA: peptidoglycan-associated lipoprotein Pal [Terriglobales bacterium]|nr:peptidoglycan-associated lipoprotein Pal [Terriglobales bacterium]